MRDGIATLRTEKSQGAITVYLPILPILQRTLDAGPVGDLAFMCWQERKAFHQERSEMPLRRPALPPGSSIIPRMAVARSQPPAPPTMVRRLRSLNAIFGWRGTAMASLYTEEADRKRLAGEAIRKLENEIETSMAAPRQEVRVLAPKRK